MALIQAWGTRSHQVELAVSLIYVCWIDSYWLSLCRICFFVCFAFFFGFFLFFFCFFCFFISFLLFFFFSC